MFSVFQSLASVRSILSDVQVLVTIGCISLTLGATANSSHALVVEEPPDFGYAYRYARDIGTLTSGVTTVRGNIDWAMYSAYQIDGSDVFAFDLVPGHEVVETTLTIHSLSRFTEFNGGAFSGSARRSLSQGHRRFTEHFKFGEDGTWRFSHSFPETYDGHYKYVAAVSNTQPCRGLGDFINFEWQIDIRVAEVVPLPSSLLLLGTAASVLGVAAARRRHGSPAG